MRTQTQSVKAGEGAALLCARTETNAPRLGTGSDGVLLDHVEELVHPVLLDFGLDDDANGHGG